MPESYITDAMRGAIGTETERRVSYPVSASDIRRWALAVYYPELPPREYIDEDYAAQQPSGGIIAPQEFNPFAWLVAKRIWPEVLPDRLNLDRIEIILGVPGPGLKSGFNGSNEAEYGVPMRPGDVITGVARLAGYSERSGRFGLMLFTTIEDTWTNHNNETVKRYRNTLIRY